jgi:hypothetical protein
MSVGESTLTFELVPNWEQLPAGWTHGDVAGVATDSQDRVFVFNRSEHPVIVYEPDGRFLGSWGEGVFTRPHGITIHGDVVYCADDTDHTVRAFTLEGKLLWTLGTLNQPSDTGYSPEGRSNLLSIRRGAGPFNRPTRLAVAPNGTVSVNFYDRRLACPTAGSEATAAGLQLDQHNPNYTGSLPPYGAVDYCVNSSVQFYSASLKPIGHNIRLTQNTWDPQLNSPDRACACVPTDTFLGDYFGNDFAGTIDYSTFVSTYDDGSNPQHYQQQVVASVAIPIP